MRNLKSFSSRPFPADEGNLAAKRAFLKIVGSNFFLKDRSLTCRRAYLYDEVAKISPSRNWLRLVDVARTYFKSTLEIRKV